MVGGDANDLLQQCAPLAGHAIGAIDSTLTIAGTELDPGMADAPCGIAFDGCHIGDAPAFVVAPNTVYVMGPCLSPTTGAPLAACLECDINYDVTASGLDAPIPRLLATGSDVPSMQRTLELYGPPAEIGVIALSLAPTFTTLPGQGQWLWVDLGAPLFKLLFVASQTFTTPATRSLTIPAPDPDLDGVVVHAQALFPLLPGVGTAAGTLVTNPTNIILRPSVQP